MRRRVAYLGPQGTFTEEAAFYFIGEGKEEGEHDLIDCSSIDKVASSVENGEAEVGVLPLENSIEGSVNVTLDYLAASDSLFICAEVIRPVVHCLLTVSGRDYEIKTIYSHPQALAQCRRYLQTSCPQATGEAVASTAQAASRVVVEGEGRAAIAPERAALLYGLKVKAKGIEDVSNNATRFIVVARSDSPPSGNDKTSIIVNVKDSPGSLYMLLGIFAQRKINLTRIESRPARTSIGEYLFFIDLNGHRSEPVLSAALDVVRDQSRYLKILGSYPACQWNP